MGFRLVYTSYLVRLYGKPCLPAHYISVEYEDRHRALVLYNGS